MGDWDPGTSTGTLTQNVFETIQIGASGITLDGGGFTVSGNGAGAGVFFGTLNKNVTIKNLRIENFASGILVMSGENITIEGNHISSNVMGIETVGLLDSVIARNMISNNSFRGVYLWASDGNQIYNNNFVDNPYEQAYANGGDNVFDLPLPIGGNYWSVWTGPDSDGDGFVDVPYAFSYEQDNFPWTVADGWANQAPVADAGGPYIAGATGWDGALLSLDAECALGALTYDGFVVEGSDSIRIVPEWPHSRKPIETATLYCHDRVAVFLFGWGALRDESAHCGISRRSPSGSNSIPAAHTFCLKADTSSSTNLLSSSRAALSAASPISR